MNEEIKSLLKEIGITEVGFVKLEYFKDLEERLLKQEKLGFKTNFQVGEIDEKTFKNSSFYQSAIVCLLPYQKNNIILSKDEVSVSSSSWGEDYHRVLKNKLNIVVKYLEDKKYKSIALVDNNLYDERFLAYKAGLGFYGVNGLLINERLGSYFFIGVIYTDALLKYDKELNKTCLKCMKCVTACPGKAINETGILDGNKCLSYITQKKKLTKEEESLIGQCIYGCDVCAKVCPHNENILVNNNFIKDEDIIINVNKYKNMSNMEFKKKYGKYAFSWRGKKIFERNIDIYKQKLEKNK